MPFTQCSRRPALRAALAVAALVAVLGPSRPCAAADELTRVTTSFEAEHVGLVLKRVAKLFSAGFTRSEAERVTAEIDKLQPDQEGSWTFTATFNRKTVPLGIRAAVDDMAMVDLDFTTDPVAAERIRREIDAFSAERGL